MNSWKLNSTAGHHFRMAICKNLKISHTEIYKKIKNVDSKGTITTKDGKKFIIELKQIN